MYLTKKGQVAIEFVMLIGILFMAMIIFVYFVTDSYVDASDDTDYLKLKDMALSVQSEVNIVSGLESGYTRNFFIPFTLDGTEYNITKWSSTQVLFQTASADYLITTPPFTGEFSKGNNNVKKDDAGVITVSSI